MSTGSQLALPAPFERHGEHIAVTLGAATAMFTTRRGGVSSGPYESLNLGLLTDDEPAAVTANRGIVAREFGVQLAWGRQVHGTGVEVRSEPNAPGAEPTPADAQATSVPGLAPMVLSADCLTVAVAGDGAVAVAHAGWRGLAAGVLGATVQALRELGAAGTLRAAIGPGAGPCCYEVGEEVHDRFARFGPGVRRGQNLDLKYAASADLASAGVEIIHDVGLCTICTGPSRFFSHRRDGGVTGRQAAVVWLS